MVFSGQQHVTI